MAHERREPPAGSSTADEYCEECGRVTVWYLTLGSAIPGVSGTWFQWVCTGVPSEDVGGKA